MDARFGSAYCSIFDTWQRRLRPLPSPPRWRSVIVTLFIAGRCAMRARHCRNHIPKPDACGLRRGDCPEAVPENVLDADKTMSPRAARRRAAAPNRQIVRRDAVEGARLWPGLPRQNAVIEARCVLHQRDRNISSLRSRARAFDMLACPGNYRSPSLNAPRATSKPRRTCAPRIRHSGFLVRARS